MPDSDDVAGGRRVWPLLDLKLVTDALSKRSVCDRVVRRDGVRLVENLSRFNHKHAPSATALRLKDEPLIGFHRILIKRLECARGQDQSDIRKMYR